MASTHHSQLDQRIVAGTDVATFYLFHPDDLAHRVTSPLAWESYHFACQPEFEAGRLIAVGTGGDGTYAFRITDGPLTEREKEWLASSWTFRYVVRHGRVYLDGGYALPSEDYIDDSEDHPQQWFSLANGKYQVTVNAIDWSSEPGSVDANRRATERALPGYVIQFSPVENLSGIKVSATPPRLETSKEWQPKPSRSHADYETFEEEDVELVDSYALLVSKDDVPVPGLGITLDVNEEFCTAVKAAKSRKPLWGNQTLACRIKQAVIASSEEVPCLGAIADPGHGGQLNGGQWIMPFRPKRLVRVTALEKERTWHRGAVERLDRTSSRVAADDLNRLKMNFSAYAKSNHAYRTVIRHPDFEADRVTSLESAEGVTNLLIHHVQMPRTVRLQLLQLSDADRVQRLNTILNATKRDG